MGYEYITENNLYSKQNYMYSKFKGFDFFKEYLQSRKLEVLGKDICEEDIKEESETYLDILDIYNNFDGDKENKLKKLDYYVKSFEVRKRLYTSYFNRKPMENSSFENYEIYLLFAEVLSKAYEITDCLKYFSCLLKVNDTLLSIQDKLNHNQKKLLKSIINKEIQFFKELCKKHEIGEVYL